MRHSLAHLALVVAIAGSQAATAQGVMKVCGDEWQQAKAADTTDDETWPQFLEQCRARQNRWRSGPSFLWFRA